MKSTYLTEDSIAVREIIDAYVEATYTADEDKLRSLFHKKAIMQGELPDLYVEASGSPELFFKDISSQPSMKSKGIPYASQIDYFDVKGCVASVTLSESNFFGKGTFVNYFNLIKEDSRWWIISKTFTYRS